MEKSIDYCLVEQIKAGSVDAQEKLYKRYTRLIHRRAGQAFCDHEDFMQDAYFAMLKAVDHIDFDKVTNPHDWGFFYNFDRYLLKILYPINKTAACETAVDPAVFSPSTARSVKKAGSINKSIFERSQSSTTLESQIIEQRVEARYDEFVVSLSDLHRTTLEGYQSLGDKKSMIAAARLLNRPYKDVIQDIKQLKKDALEFFGVMELV